MTSTFQVGTTYKMLWVTDADAVTPCKVVKRTAKFVTFELPGFGVKADLDGNEVALPLGSYSMAPCVRAERVMA
jgi:hypothetical protein